MSKAIHIVDDDLGFLSAIQRLLKAHGLEIVAFSSVEDFQEYGDPDQAACLILDIHIGHLSGIDLMKTLFRSGCKAPVVLVTANDNDQMRQAAWNAGCSAFLQKPIPAKVLIGTLRDVASGAFNGIGRQQT